MTALINNEQYTQHQGLARLGLDQQSVRVLVVGLGLTGLSVVKFLQQNNVSVAVVDSRENPPGLVEVEESYQDVAVFTSSFEHAVFEAATHIIVSPGVSLDEAEIQAAAERGIPVFGDIDVFAVCVDGPVACITGSNGKSTVTTLLGKMAISAGLDARVGGNIGIPALDLLTDQPADLYILELSSFQLERTSQLTANVAAILNVSADHMDRYSSLANYSEAKERVLYGPGIAVLNRHDKAVQNMILPTGRKAVSFGLDEATGNDYGLITQDGKNYLTAAGEPVIASETLKLKGAHNIQNALAAMAMADSLGIARVAQQQAMASFTGLAHRTQWVADIDGVTWINDSKATNPGACLAALEGLLAPIILIAGGDGKDASFSLLTNAIEANVSLVILLGRDAQRFQQEAIVDTPCFMVDTIEQAVLKAKEQATVGDMVLLSPACASLDQFDSYQQRGDRFNTAVKGLLK